jgi:hypothetical protein
MTMESVYLVVSLASHLPFDALRDFEKDGGKGNFREEEETRTTTANYP